MKCKGCLTIFTLVTVDLVLCQSTSTEWPYDSKITFPFSTHSPININSSAAHCLVAPPVEFTNALFDIGVVVNTGKAIEGFITRGNTSSSITGGPFFQNKYRFYKVRLYWNNKKGRCGVSVDGIGVPLEVMLIYYKAEYGSFQKALARRDGLAVAYIQIAVQPKMNIFFGPVQRLFKQLKTPGSYGFIFSSIFYLWFDVIIQSQVYYTYPGSYVDLETGQVYYSTIELVFQPVVAYISNEQFTVFQNLRNKFGALLQNVSPIFQAGNRPVRKGIGTRLRMYKFQ